MFTSAALGECTALQGEWRGTSAVKNLMQPEFYVSDRVLLCLEEEDYSSQYGKESK